MVTFYQNWSENGKNPGNGWKVTFEALFDMSVEEFYMFDDFMLKDREEQLSILPSNSIAKFNLNK